MEYGICNLSMIPLRAEASDKSEIVSQLLFGEHFQITGKQKQWRKIHNAYDDYEGWLDEKQFTTISEEDFRQLNNQPGFVSFDLVQVILNNSIMTPLVIASSLPFYDNGTCRIGEQLLNYEGTVKNTAQANTDKNLIVENAYTFLNSPYLWGGRSPFGIDCSGLTQVVFKLNGIKIKRDASQQAEQGFTLNMLEEAEPGDLAFFDNEEGKIIHVGIILPQLKIIHASGKVRIDKLDHHGIFNEETKKYTHKLRVLKRYI